MRNAILYTIDHWEGGLTDDPADAGGLTNFGISHRAYPTLDIANLTKEEAVNIYARDYWQAVNIDLLPESLRWKVFDMGVNMYPTRAVVMLQNAVGAVPDGRIGPDTVKAIQVVGEGETLSRLIEAQVTRYVNIIVANPSQLKFLKGWVRRAFDKGAQKESMP